MRVNQARRRFRDHRSGAYAPIEAGLEREFGLPAGLLGRIRTRGEQSDADEVSPRGARTVYQVIPSTRRLFMQRYGVDAWSSPQNAARVAALHLLESYQRTGSWDRAITEYHGGTNPRNWGPRTRAYRQRVRG